MTEELPIEQVRTFTHLRTLLNRLHSGAGRPGLGEIRWSASVPGAAAPSRARLLRILRGSARPNREELRSLLAAYGVPEKQRRRWEAAWARAEAASGRGRVAAVGPGTGAGPAREAEDPRAATARLMVEVRERCAERLGRLKGELAAAHARVDPGDPGANTRLLASLDLALRRLRDIIDEAYAEVLAGPSGATPASTADAAPSPAPGPDAATAPDGGSVNGGGPSDEALDWLPAAQQVIPPGVFAQLLRVMRDAPLFNHIAQERPLLMAELLAALPPVDAAAWLQTWEPSSAVEALSATAPPRSAACLAQMPVEVAASLLAGMGQRRSAAILAEMHSEPAARRLIAMGPAVGAPVLERMERGAAAARLIQIDRIDQSDSATTAKFLSLMSPATAAECLERMDQEAAERQEARELLGRIAGTPGGASPGGM